MAWSKASRHQRGYGVEHERIRAELLTTEPLCRLCWAKGTTQAATIADHIVPLSRGGRTERSNYQPLCKPCSDAKTAEEAGRPLRRKPRIGLDGWPIDDT